MMKNHMPAVVTLVLLVMNFMAIVVSLGTGNVLLMGLNILCMALLSWMLYREWKACQKARKKQILLG